VIDVGNMLPTRERPQMTPYALWERKKIDLKDTPLIPFGSVVKGHIPLELQTATSGRSFNGIVTGWAPGFKGVSRFLIL
jgi:hypothetical protein